MLLISVNQGHSYEYFDSWQEAGVFLKKKTIFSEMSVESFDFRNSTKMLN